VRSRGRQPVEGDGEAELEGAALQRVRTGGATAGARPGTGGGRASARLAQQPGRRGEERGGDVERRGLAMPPPRSLVDGPRQRRRRLRRERLLDGAEIRPHRRRPPLINRSASTEKESPFGSVSKQLLCCPPPP
jgi:hypothetical protein